MADRIATLWPEIIIFITVSVVIIMGLSPRANVRSLTMWIAGLGLFIAFIFALKSPRIETLPLPALAQFMKPAVCLIGIVLLLGMGAIDHNLEQKFQRTNKFEALSTTRGEFLAFFLLSLTGVLLCTTATDLIWLFLALELTSLPTYVMVAKGRSQIIGHEASVKYFFLGALSAAIFLYGFALIYGATGSMHLNEIRQVFFEQASTSTSSTISILGLLGVILALIGISFKIAAVPMHFYTADVYEGAATPVSAFLAFVPKTAGFVSIMLILSTVMGLGSNGETWPETIYMLLWIIAVATMTVGNTLALLQRNVKRILAYSSIAHSGYILIGVIAGISSLYTPLTSNGFAAVMFYLVSYGIMNIGAFLVLGCLTDNGREIETLDDLSGLSRKHPWLSAILAVCAMSLLGLPPLIGFLGKLYLFSAGIAAGEIILVVIAGLNSAISAWYYLKIAGLPWLGQPTAITQRLVQTPYRGRNVAAALSAVGVIILIFAASPIMSASFNASQLAASIADQKRTPYKAIRVQAQPDNSAEPVALMPPDDEK